VLDTYYPETGRYGTGAALDAAEAVFAADSAAAVAQLAMTTSGTPHPYAVTAASFTDLATAFTGSLNGGLTWLAGHVHRHPAPPVDGDVHDQAMRLADPSGDWATLRALPGGDQLALAWERRRAVLAAYRAHLTAQRGPEPDPVLASLLHLHHARTAGVDQNGERLCLRLARAAAIGWTERNDWRERNGRRRPSPPTSAIPTPPPK
jgi:thiopeptide-type bacteriocin biosynthesis protein